MGVYDPAKPFPILMDPRERKAHPECPRSIPWAILAPHEAQARRNHDQSLATLASRGGLDPVEMTAILRDERYRPLPMAEAIGFVLAAVASLDASPA
jgi:hypothetical protein